MGPDRPSPRRARRAPRPRSARRFVRLRAGTPASRLGRNARNRQSGGVARPAVRATPSTRTGQSCRGMSWPMPGTSTSSAPGMARAVARPPDTWTSLSLRPWMTRAGIVQPLQGLGAIGLSQHCLHLTDHPGRADAPVVGLGRPLARLLRGDRVRRRADRRPGLHRALDGLLPGALGRAEQHGKQPRVLPPDRAPAGRRHDRHEGEHAIAVLERQCLGDHAAHRDPRDVGLVDAEMVEQPDRVVGHVAQRVGMLVLPARESADHVAAMTALAHAAWSTGRRRGCRIGSRRTRARRTARRTRAPTRSAGRRDP